MPPLYAHSKIETGAGDTYDPGDRVPADIDGRDELEKHGAISTERYEGDPVADAVAAARIGELETELRELKGRDGGSGRERTR